jgi:hypothetical protein
MDDHGALVLLGLIIGAVSVTVLIGLFDWYTARTRPTRAADLTKATAIDATRQAVEGHGLPRTVALQGQTLTVGILILHSPDGALWSLVPDEDMPQENVWILDQLEGS